MADAVIYLRRDYNPANLGDTVTAFVPDPKMGLALSRGSPRRRQCPE